VATPYITPLMLNSAPTGVSWDLIPWPGATTQEQYEEQYNCCVRATKMVDGATNQVFRATIDSEVNQGPNYYITIDNNTGQLRWILTRWPVTQILAAQVSPNTLPPSWTAVPSGNWRIATPVLGTYGSYLSGGSGGSGGQTIYLGAGYGSWALGRNGYLAACSYVNGWPHAGIVESAAAGASTLYVDNVTGFAGAAAFIYDGASSEEVYVSSVSAAQSVTLPNGGGTAPAGPGTVTLSAPTQFAHTGGAPPGVVISSIPADVIWATILAATVQALESGINAITIQNVSGSQTVGGHGVEQLDQEWRRIVYPYKRVV
jgi:hypothetical protein